MIDFFLSKVGEEIIGEVSGEPATETLRLKKKYKKIDPKLINLCIEIAVSRKKLSSLGDWVQKGLFTARGVSQMSDPIISEFRAKRFKGQRVLEIGTGLGMDTYYLSKSASEVLTVETDSITREFAEYNLSLQGIKNVVFLEDIPEGNFDSIWADPSRRDKSGNRVKDPENYSPSLSWFAGFSKPMGIKISAAHSGIFEGFSKEWIGVDFEAKEQVLWSGFDILDNTLSIPPDSFFIERSSDINLLQNLPESEFYLVEPHPVLLASGLVQSFFSSIGIFSLSNGPTLGVSEAEPKSSPLLKCYKIEEVVRSFEKISKRFSRIKYFGVPKQNIIPEGEGDKIVVVTKFNKKILGFLGRELV